MAPRCLSAHCSAQSWANSRARPRFNSLVHFLHLKTLHISFQGNCLVVVSKVLLRPDAGTGSRHMTETDILFISLLFSEVRWLQCCEGEAAVAWLWLLSGREGPLVASSRPAPERRLAFPPHPRLTSPLSVVNAAGRRDRRVNIHQMFELAFAGLILSLAYFQNDFTSSLSKFKCLETFALVQWCWFQDTLSIILGLVRNSLGDARRFSTCVAF